MDKSPDAFRTISEVADFLETPAHVLRFWESRFPQIKPVKRAGGRRYYRPADVALLAGIRQLLHQDGMTIRGVQKILRDQGVKHVIGLSDPHFQIPPDTDHDEAEGDIADVQIVDMPESEAVAAHGSTNVVALTDWRAVAEPAEAALSMATMPPATPEAEDQQVATPAPVALGGSSLAAELEAATAGGMTAQEGASPHQWSLFDLAGAETPTTLLTDPQVTADLAHAASGAALEHTALESQAALDVPLEPTAVGAAPVITGVDSLAEASSAALPDQIALRADDSSTSATPDTLSPAEIDASTPLGDRPWLPPRLRALRAASAALPSGDLAALLLRARALHGTLKEAAQPPRG